MQGEAALPRVAALDGLRGVAVAGVLLFHGGHLTGGYLGVDLFFVLSGFLITSLLLVESGRSGHVGLGHFWARRARRLLPALVGLLLGVGVYCLVIADPSELAAIRGDALATLGYVANWRAIFAGQDYWALFVAPSPLQHTWSLAIEEQFYLVWPLVFVGLLAGFGRRAPMATMVVALVGAAISGVLMSLLYDPLDPSRVYYGTDTRAGGVLLGAALAAALVIWGPVRARIGRVALEVVGVVAVAVLAVAWTHVDGQSAWLYHGGFTMCGVAVVAVIAASANPERGPIGWALSFRPLCLLGLISYGVYLWHWPVFIVLNENRTNLATWPLFAVRVLVTVVIAIASYLVIEQPIRLGAGTPRTWRLALPATAVLVVIVVVGVTLGAKPGGTISEERLSALVARVERAPAGAHRTMVVGNSVARYLAEGMGAVAAPAADLVLNRAHDACVFPGGADAIELTALDRTEKSPLSCDSDWDREVAALRPQTVMLLSWTGGDNRVSYSGQWMEECDAGYTRMYRERLELAVRRFEAKGVEVALVNSPYGQYETDDAHQPERRRVDCVNRTVKEVARSTSAQLIDLRRYVCPDAPACLDQIDGKQLRPDAVHFRGEGAQVIGRWLLSQLHTMRTPSNR